MYLLDELFITELTTEKTPAPQAIQRVESQTYSDPMNYADECVTVWRAGSFSLKAKFDSADPLLKAGRCAKQVLLCLPARVTAGVEQAFLTDLLRHGRQATLLIGDWIKEQGVWKRRKEQMSFNGGYGAATFNIAPDHKVPLVVANRVQRIYDLVGGCANTFYRISRIMNQTILNNILMNVQQQVKERYGAIMVFSGANFQRRYWIWRDQPEEREGSVAARVTVLYKGVATQASIQGESEILSDPRGLADLTVVAQVFANNSASVIVRLELSDQITSKGKREQQLEAGAVHK